jgi:hypothetical protein
VSGFATVAYDQRVHRVAFPQRSPLTITLVDSNDRADLEALLDSTNLVESHRAGERRIVAPEDDYVGDHRDYVLAPFAYRSATRFSDGSYGVFYAAEVFETALLEAVSWLTRVYADGGAPPQQTTKQYMTLRIVADPLADVRRRTATDVDGAIYDPNDYRAARLLGAQLRAQFPGVTYDSVRHRDGTCVGAFVPRIISDVRLESILELVWNGTAFVERKDVHPL